jgi:hypothetical protein
MSKYIAYDNVFDLMSYVDTESELLSYFLEIVELYWVESSRTFSHSHTVS